MDNEHFEIERKFLIRIPDPELLAQNASASEITQTYLISEKGTTARVRKRGSSGNYSYTHTVKTRISDMRRIENEREIPKEEYEELLKKADPERRTIQKTRFCLPYKGQMFEIDIFPFWKHQAYMELELQKEIQEIDFPPEIRILREVTGDRHYTNAALAREVPPEDTW